MSAGTEVTVSPSASNAGRADDRAGQEALEGRRHGLKRILPFIGPAFVACVAYIDPGNFATNITGGAQFGYNLLWVVVYANIMAMFIQTMAAKLGIATGMNLPQLMRQEFSPLLVYPLWIVAEVMAMATDLAEFVGAALGFHLLFHIPLFIAALVTAVSTFAMLHLQTRGFRPLEALITVLVFVVAGCYIVELIIGKPSLHEMAVHAVVPFATKDSILVSAGILGATVMPHVVYLHSALLADRLRPRSDEHRKRLFHFTVIDVLVAMPLAGIVNGGMLVMAAITFHQHGLTSMSDLAEAYRTLTPLLGQAAATIFAVSLLASGLSSSTVGTMAGQVIMQGFVGFTIPLWLRRTVTIVPSLVVIGLNLPTATTLVISQVILSVVLAFAVVPLVMFTQRRDIMGVLVNHRLTTLIGWLFASIIVVLNLVLIYQTLGGRMPGLS